MQRARCLLLAVTALSCTPKSHPAPEPAALAGVAVSGCGDVLEGPVCRVGTSRKLRIFVPVEAALVGVATNTGAAPGAVVPIGARVLPLRVHVVR